MTTLLSIDPGDNTGIALGFFDAVTPYRLLERWQVHGGVTGFMAWLEAGYAADVDIIICEKFDLRNNDFVADTVPLLCEGALLAAQRFGDGLVADTPIVWQGADRKWGLIGYPKTANTPDKRQRLRFQFLDRFGLFKAGTEFDDSNDAITHALVYLKGIRHYPSAFAFWPPRVHP